MSNVEYILHSTHAMVLLQHGALHTYTKPNN